MTNINAVLAVHIEALARSEDARKAFIDADANVEALNESANKVAPGDCLKPSQLRIGWLRAAERTSAAYLETLMPVPLPQEIAAAYSRLKARLSRLLVE